MDVIRLKQLGWNQSRKNPFLWVHTTGKQVERNSQDGWWYLHPVTGNSMRLAKTLKDSIAKAQKK